MFAHYNRWCGLNTYDDWNMLWTWERISWLVRKCNGISQMYEDAFIIHFDDLEYHIGIFIDALLNIADSHFDRECYGKEEIEMNQNILRDNEGLINGCTAQ